MPSLEQTIRSRTEGLPKAAVIAAAAATMAQIGGTAAFLRALAEVENERARQRARRRHGAIVQREVRA